MNRPILGPNGQPIGAANPVVAHVVTLRHPAPTKELIESIAAYWQRNLGVPCIIVTGGVELVASVLSNGELIPVEMDPEMTVKVQTLIDGRSEVRPGTMPEVVPDTVEEILNEGPVES